MIKRMLFYLLGVSLLGLLISCGGGSGTRPNFSRGIVRDGVIAIPDDGTVTITNQTDTGLTLSGTNPAIATIKLGSVIVIAKGQGLAVKVKTIAINGGQTVLGTESARLTDIFSELDIHQNQSLNSIDLATVNTAPGVTYAGRSRDGGTITLQLSHVSPLPNNNGEIDLSGSLELSGSIDMDMQTDGDGVRLLRFAPTLTEKLAVSLSFKKTVGTPIYGHQLPIADFSGTPIVIPVGPVPVIILPKFKVYLKLLGRVEGGIKTGVSLVCTETLGVKYDRTNGWSSNASSSASGVADPVTVYANLTGSIGPAADVQFFLFGLVGPTISIAAPEYEVKLTSTTNPASIKLKTNILAEGFVAVKAGIFGYDFGVYDPGLLVQKRWPLSDQTFLPGDAKIGVQ